VLHSTVVEILLFMTPRHRADIVASLVASLNATYARFKCRNPSFGVGAQLQGVSVVQRKADRTGSCECSVVRSWAIAVAQGLMPGPITTSATASNMCPLSQLQPASPCLPAVCPCAMPLPGLQGSVSILSHSLGSVLCYDILCSQPLSPAAVEDAAMLPHSLPPSPGNPGNSMLASPPASPPASPQRWPAQQQQQQLRLSGMPGSAGQSLGADAMLIDLTGADSRSAALQQELLRLRAENQRLQLQLEVARAEGTGLRGSGGGDGPSFGQQQRAAVDVSVGAAPSAVEGISPLQQGFSLEAAGATWPPLQFR
jgi:hypothetical protein